MLDKVKQIKKFVSLQFEYVVSNIVLCYYGKISMSEYDKGVLAGKRMAYEDIWDFIEDMEETQKEKNEIRQY